ncbi:AAC(3) family N-acetyltransferase [Streptomyces sp. CB03911]|uniref:aminoglycoside N(3)-acetyltransferase n=1 Tax=Streptomycetaceae TaxID=2062 RepID=UPI00257086FC|nr:AAC(3) family N-acetyltransferase [Streptomyces sp. CB03911]
MRPGDLLFVQASLRSLGPVAGGPATVVGALLDALGGPPDGTLVAYTATPENSDTSRLAAALTEGLSPAEAEAHRTRMPAFDPARTPSSPTMGALSEVIRTTPGARRSNHPQTSFAAVGPLAREVTRTHDLDCHLGQASPLGRLHELGAKVLLLGVPLARFTAFHLADLRMPDLRRRRYGCVVQDGSGGGRWVHFEAPELDDLHFPALGEALLREGAGLRRGPVGDADALLVPMAEAVAVATRSLLRDRSPQPV